MNFTDFIGIDVSKHTLDFAINRHGDAIFHLQVENSEKGIDQFLRQAKKEIKDFCIEQSLFCMEHTGIYNYPSLKFLNHANAHIWLESGTHIKYSQGIQRGRNDKIDAQRIAMYAFKNQTDARFWKPKRKVLLKLHYLVSMRSRLIVVKTQLKTPVQETKGFIPKEISKEYSRACHSSIKALEKDIKNVDKQIDQIIASDEQLNRLFNQITSVQGVGPQTALELIITTNEFKNINEAKKLACHAGVAPFSYRSGKSIRGKNRVSHKANKRLKMLLHLGALTVVNNTGDLQNYYHRKVEEGKNKMAVLNAIRNKLVHRVCAVVRENRKYDKNYIITVA